MQRLATYGTLGPGRSNHDQVSGIAGRWMTGTVRGHLVAAGWGADVGFPGLVLDPDADPVQVDLLVSPELEQHWRRLDDFEGIEYARVRTTVTTRDGEVDAYIYVIAADQPR